MCTNLNYNIYKAVFLNSLDVFIVFEILKSKLFEVLIACHWLDFSSEIEEIFSEIFSVESKSLNFFHSVLLTTLHLLY